MGIYRDALRVAAATGTVPDIVADDREGRHKYGFGINVEQPLADDGETGVRLAREHLSDSFEPELLWPGRYHADGQLKDRHAHHRSVLTQLLRQERHDRWARRWAPPKPG